MRTKIAPVLLRQRPNGLLAGVPGVQRHRPPAQFYLFHQRPQGRLLAAFDAEHGRYEGRWIRVSDDLDPYVPYVDFPEVTFVAQIRRQTEVVSNGLRRERETEYLLTSLPAQQATPKRLLRLNRGCWGAVENQVHRVRDNVLCEDACHARKGPCPACWRPFPTSRSCGCAAWTICGTPWTAYTCGPTPLSRSWLDEPERYRADRPNRR